MRNWFHGENKRDRGNFRGANDELRTLFSDPDARGSRRWREVFGFEPAERVTALRGAPTPINECAALQSSSDW